MYGEWVIRSGDVVFIEAKDDFYKVHLSGWFNITSVTSEKDRFAITNHKNGDSFKMFRNKQGICCVVEHEYNKYGESTWDEEKQLHRFIFVPVDMFVKSLS